MAISKRLKAIAKYTEGFKSLADIACDHGYLGIYAVENYGLEEVLLTDINPMPLASAIKNTELKNLEHIITCKLGDGLTPLEKDYEVITISGIGGMLMKDILFKGLDRIKNAKRLVLCPNTDAYEVRKFLIDNGFAITHEEMVFENKYYEIIISKFENTRLSHNDLELKYGPVLLKTKPIEFINYYKEQLKFYEKQIIKITDSISKEKMKNKIDEINMILGNIL